MAAITYSSVEKTAHLDRVESASDDKYYNIDEQGARIRRAEINYTNSTGSGVSDPVVIGRFDEANVEILKIELISDDAVADFDVGHTPISAPVDTDKTLGDAEALVANTLLTLKSAINVELTVPSLIFINPQSGDIANGAYVKGNIYYTIKA